MSILDLVRPSDLTRVAALEVFAREVVEGFCAGRHRSPHTGSSVEFKGHRQYVRGDDLRKIDWKVYGKSDKLFIREREDDTDLRCHLLVDASGSMGYRGERSGGLSKFEYAARLAACLSYLMLSQQDSVGLVTFDSRPLSVLPPRSVPTHLKAMLAALLIDPVGRETDLGDAFRRIAAKLPRRGLVVILSDAMGDLSSLRRSLTQFRGSQHDVIFMQVLDPDELDFPFTGRIELEGLERAAERYRVDASSLRSRYLGRLQEHQQTLRKICRDSQVDWVCLTTDRPYADALAEFLTRRRGRR